MQTQQIQKVPKTTETNTNKYNKYKPKKNKATDGIVNLKKVPGTSNGFADHQTGLQNRRWFWVP